MRGFARTLRIVGGALVAIGVAWLVLPGYAPDRESPTLAFALLAVLAFAAGTARLTSRVRSSTDRPTLEGPRGRVPGDGFDEALDAVSVTGRDDDRLRETIVERLEDAAIEVLAGERGHAKADVERRLAAGAWTDDPVAAAFFRDGTEPDRSRRERLRALATGEPTLCRRGRRVVTELERIAEGDDDPG